MIVQLLAVFSLCSPPDCEVDVPVLRAGASEQPPPRQSQPQEYQRPAVKLP